MNGLEGFDAHWVWIAIGLILAALEMLVPGVYLIWLAIAAIITGLLTLGIGLGLPAQIVVFVSLSLIAAFSAKRFLRDSPIESSDPLLNQRGTRLIGENALVTQAIDGGSGRVKYGDSEWIARGPDIAEGERVRITGSDGAILMVEPLNLIADSPAGDPDDAGGKSA
ncbi:MAG: NfeD family protein [Altererythrobacter sp.]|nr:NfeD family protein [Altererythrobacter sp.]MBT8431103.1 NfeD family protein [Altererythrobacter sp.]NNE49254.1 NfeD family protein [Altererythrobacter sp.]NNF93079.1 NfeD family protein [Altererythrobacter sp.]NNK45145.1 NfeD family protein [Altererythrobacter sp.]